MQKPLKISIGMQLRTGPWGGSNQFGVALVEYLQQRGVRVVFDLNEADIDLILLTDPRQQGMSATYRSPQIIEYLMRKNWRTLVVHRLNTSDEGTDSHNINMQLMRANRCADHTVFISQWLRTIFFHHGLNALSTSVILNGADSKVFNPEKHVLWNHTEKLRFITHHWSNNFLKGFDIYVRLDQLLQYSPFQEKMSFTYVGNLPQGFQLTNGTHIFPKNGMELADILRQHHVYLTAAQNEAGGMHHIEGALCGLPLLYRESGALPDYCKGFGIAFTPDNFEEKLRDMLAQYDEWAARMPVYPYTAEKMCAAYYDLFCHLCEQRDTILRQRQRKRLRWLVARLWQHIRRKPSK